jgi:hypothetical protein
MNRKAAAVLVPACLLLLCVAAFLGVFIQQGLAPDLGRASLGTSFDFHSYFLPRFVLGSSELRHGSLPLWNAFEYGGIPLLATTQPAVLYVPRALFYHWFSPVAAHWVWLAFHFAVLIGTFQYFLWDEGITGVPAFVGGAMWAFQTLLLGSCYSPIRIANLVFIPPMLVFARAIAVKKSVAAFAALALVVGLQLTAGYPEFFFDEALILVVFAGISYWTKNWPMPPWKSIPLFGAAFTLGAIVAAAQLVPLAELALVSQRSQLASGQARMLPPDLARWLFRLTPGLLSFGVLGFFVRRARPAALGLVLCWAVSQGGWLLLRWLPGFSYVRFPFIWIFFVALFFAWMAAIAADAVLGGEGLSPRGRRVALVFTAVCALLLVGRYVVYAAGFFAGKEPSPGFGQYLENAKAAVLGAVGGALLAAAAVFSLRRKAPPDRVRTSLWYLATTLLVLSHLAAYPFGVRTAPFTRPAQTGELAHLHGNPRAIQGRVVSLEDILHGYEITDRLKSPFGAEYSFMPFRSRQLMDRLEFVSLFAAINWQKLMNAKGFLDAEDVEFLTTDASLAPLLESHGLVQAGRAGNVVLFENPGRMGHAWVNHAVTRITDQGAALNYVLGPEFDPRRAVVLEQATTHGYPNEAGADVTTPVGERRRTSTDVEFDVELTRAGVFVISESTYPGWDALVDGQVRPWQTADYFFRGVELEPGRHTVRFTYRPWSVRIGFALSALGLLLVGALFVVARRRARATRAPS